MTSNILVLEQQGIIRPAGFQVTQWMTLVPQVPNNPTPSPPLAVATNPSSLVPIFIVNNVGGMESLERIATPRDLATYPPPDLSKPWQGNELVYFEARGFKSDPSQSDGWQLFNALPNDVLSFPSAAQQIWLQDNPAVPPYDTNNFVVNGVVTRASGTVPIVLSGGQLILTGYTFSEDDVGRWVQLSGFTVNTIYNTWTQILSVAGSVAQTSLPVGSGETGGAWVFKRVQIKTFPLDVSPPPPFDYDPRYFPTKVRDAQWILSRGSSIVAQNGAGGTTLRINDGPGLSASGRFTSVLGSQQAALDFMTVTRSAVQQLQQQLSLAGTSFTTIVITQFGP